MPRPDPRPTRRWTAAAAAATVGGCLLLGSLGGAPVSGAAAGAPTRGAPAVTVRTTAKVATITIENFSFSPGKLTVKPGQKVKVKNEDAVTHTLTSTTKKFDTGDIEAGRTKTFTAPKKAGRYPYLCMIHQYMTGTLTVS
jgi:plastocyanin